MSPKVFMENINKKKKQSGQENRPPPHKQQTGPTDTLLCLFCAHTSVPISRIHMLLNRLNWLMVV